MWPGRRLEDAFRIEQAGGVAGYCARVASAHLLRWNFRHPSACVPSATFSDGITGHSDNGAAPSGLRHRERHSIVDTDPDSESDSDRVANDCIDNGNTAANRHSRASDTDNIADHYPETNAHRHANP